MISNEQKIVRINLMIELCDKLKEEIIIGRGDAVIFRRKLQGYIDEVGIDEEVLEEKKLIISKHDLLTGRDIENIKQNFIIIKNRVEEDIEYSRRIQESKPKNDEEEFWKYTHPLIISVAKDRFKNAHYADAVEAATKEINSRVKRIYRKISGEELDGAKLMQRIFSLNNPVLKFEDTSTETGQNVQNGFMHIFTGTMIGIRNPKAHENLTITKEQAIQRLILAGLLMNKIDEALKFSGIQE